MISGNRDISSYEVVCEQALLVLECFSGFRTDGGFTDSRSACDPPAVLGVRRGACPLLDLVQHFFACLIVIFSLFLLFPVVLGLWDGAVTKCLLNKL